MNLGPATRRDETGRARRRSGLLTPFGGRVLQRFRGGSLLKISAPAASIVRESLLNQRGRRIYGKKVGRDGAPSDDLRAVLDKRSGVQYTYTYKYIKSRLGLRAR